ncbi:hypothetical protein [Streptomyces sp. NBC_01506]|uniref:hypothetical protein n=1 Tax=Streptomyces sp. NBC_01506 TaxID=2903887 RepID=UPI003863556B
MTAETVERLMEALEGLTEVEREAILRDLGTKRQNVKPAGRPRTPLPPPREAPHVTSSIEWVGKPSAAS